MQTGVGRFQKGVELRPGNGAGPGSGGTFGGSGRGLDGVSLRLLTILGRFRHFEGDRVGGGRDDGVNFRNEANFGAGRGSWSGTRSGDLLRRAQGDPWL